MRFHSQYINVSTCHCCCVLLCGGRITSPRTYFLYCYYFILREFNDNHNLHSLELGSSWVTAFIVGPRQAKMWFKACAKCTDSGSSRTFAVPSRHLLSIDTRLAESGVYKLHVNSFLISPGKHMFRVLVRSALPMHC